MGQQLVLAGSTLLALVVGVLVEPFKNGFAHKARLRQLRTERCEELTAAALAHVAARATAVIRASGFSDRYFESNDEEWLPKSVAELNNTLANVQAVAAAIYLIGPDDLGSAAMDLSNASHGPEELDPTKFKIGQTEFDRIMMEYRVNFREQLDEFVRVARKHISK